MGTLTSPLFSFYVASVRMFTQTPTPTGLLRMTARLPVAPTCPPARCTCLARLLARPCLLLRLPARACRSVPMPLHGDRPQPLHFPLARGDRLRLRPLPAPTQETLAI